MVVYAPPSAVRSRPDLLDRLQSEHEVRAVILRSPDAAAFDEVRQRGLEAWWLAPGLWGEVEPARERQAEFPEVPGWAGNPLEAFEARWPMFCPTDPDLPQDLASSYARRARELGATGIYCTHLRYHHPADVQHLWGCICPRCRSGMVKFGLSVEEIADFWKRLSEGLRRRSVGSWDGEERKSRNGHPLVRRWASLAESDFPLRWFAWKNATLENLFSKLVEALRRELPDTFVASNSFEPFWANLVGHAGATLESSAWYSPLLGYWPTHVRQSAFNLAVWQARLGGEQSAEEVLSALARVLGLGATFDETDNGVAKELRLSSEIAANLGLPYWPVLNGTSGAGVSLRRCTRLAREAGAQGVVLQGISQLLQDRTLDFWY